MDRHEDKPATKWVAKTSSEERQSEIRENESTLPNVLDEQSIQDFEEFLRISPEERAEMMKQMRKTSEEVRNEMMPPSSECPEEEKKIEGSLTVAEESRNENEKSSPQEECEAPEESAAALRSEGSGTGRVETGDATVTVGKGVLAIAVACTQQGCAREILPEEGSGIAVLLWAAAMVLVICWMTAKRAERQRLPQSSQEETGESGNRAQKVESSPRAGNEEWFWDARTVLWAWHNEVHGLVPRREQERRQGEALEYARHQERMLRPGAVHGA